MKVVEACLQIIWKSRMDGNMKFWALENPVGFLRQFLGIPRHTIRQWWYGADQDKPTDLWGYYNFPSPTVMEKPPGLQERESIAMLPGGRPRNARKSTKAMYHNLQVLPVGPPFAQSPRPASLRHFSKQIDRRGGLTHAHHNRPRSIIRRPRPGRAGTAYPDTPDQAPDQKGL